MRKVILETNFFMAQARDKADIYSIEGKLYTLESCINELKRIAKERTRRGMHARVALEIMKGRDIEIIRNQRNADKTLMEYSEKGYIIATNDSAIIKELKELGRNVIRIKQKKIMKEEYE